MELPTACYRLQFREGMDFDRAAGIAPYLRNLGVSHLYASPLFTAAPGSTHGYDVTDPTEVEPEIGGREGLERLSRALRAEGLGLVLDIVPNHMAFSPEAPWLRDVMRWGTDSRYARHFDIDWSQRLRLPWLPAPFETHLAEDGFTVVDEEDGPALDTGGLRIPLADTPGLAAARSGDRDAIRALHAEQPWRLVHWRTEADAIAHRRFFNVTGLIGLRVEEEQVFEDSHALLFELVEAGIVQGVRLDHIDGLLDPAQYLARLRARLPDTPIWAEKILTGPEQLPPDWPIEGTTGYVAARAFGRLLTDADGLDRIDSDYRAATGRTDPAEDVLAGAKRQIMTEDLSAELWALNMMFAEIAAADPVGVEFGPERLREALIEMIAAFPRYRTYMTARTVSEEDAALVRRAGSLAASRLPAPGAVPLLTDILTRPDAETARFRLRFQQVTGAAVAKSQEDTAFYREVRLLSTNEVGGEPDDDPFGPAGFHRAMLRRAARMPHALTLTTSHDTKRSEDARMRIAAASHAPDAFAELFRLCDELASDDLHPNLRWYLAQTLLALDSTDSDIEARLHTHVEKALREAKTETYWTAPNETLEASAREYASRLVDRLLPHPEAARPILEIADRLSLAQCSLKLTVPGVCDIYQGCEIANYSLTDPDNRRPVDFAALDGALSDVSRLARPLDRAKFDLTRSLLHLRRARPELFLDGSYTPRETDNRICAFSREHGEETLSVAVALEPGVTANELEAAAPGELIWPKAIDAPVRIAIREG
ncbi:hydrolase [Roseivivax halodurans JCM 10272]|uniref:Hydrolase n=2 Tax=Roseivivax halodurans TaxID=93683 RepID=X7EEH1_9RHOB|nr:hydrolase [Roseivivax halodurans JCM 10272]